MTLQWLGPRLADADGCAITPERIVNLLPGLVAYFGSDLRYLFANDAYARWRGLPPSAIMGRYVREIVGERNYPLIVENLRRALAGEHVTYEYYIFDDDHRRRVQGSYVPDVNSEGKVVGVVTLVTDISRRDDLQLRVAQSEAMFNEAFENAPIGKVMVSVDGHLIRSNRAFADMLGSSIQDIEGLNQADIIYPEDVGIDESLLRSLIAKERHSYCIEKRYLRMNGALLHAKLAVSAIRDDRGDVIRLFAHVEDVTQQREAERKLVETNARLSLVSDAVRGGSWHMNIDREQFETSEALAQFVAGPDAQPLDLAGYCAKIDPDDLAASDLRPLIDGTYDRSSVEYRLHTYSGMHWMRCDRRLLRDAQGRPEQIVGVTIDLTDEHERRMLAENQASSDPLTGLLNRRGLEQRLSELHSECACGLILIDLDNFKQVNDQLGHNVGDGVLVEAANRLKLMVRGVDMVARLGGDEFAVVLVDVDLDGVKSLAERLTKSLQRPFQERAGTALTVGASVGAIWSSFPPMDDTGIFPRADKALYEAKAAGRGTWRLAVIGN